MKFTTLGQTEEDRRTKIVDYITNYQGCNVQDVIKGVENYVSRVTVFKIIDSLEKVGAIRKQKDKPNSRDYKLFVDSNNPLISVPIEFKEFKRYYYPLLERVRKEAQEYLTSLDRSDTGTYEYFACLGSLGLIFGEFIRIYDTRALLIWPKQIRDNESLRTLYMLLFSEVLEIRGKINSVFQSLFSDVAALTDEGIFANIGVGLLGWVPHALLELNDRFTNTAMETDANRALKYVFEIWEKEYDSYELKAGSLIKKMDQQFGNFPSSGKQNRKSKVLKI